MFLQDYRFVDVSNFSMYRSTKVLYKIYNPYANGLRGIFPFTQVSSKIFLISISTEQSVSTDF